MSTPDGEFLALLRATFRVEAAEHLQAIAAGLVALERETAPGARRAIVETVFRAAHSLKGAARAVDFTDVESLCESMEDSFAIWKRQERAPTPALLDALHRTLDSIGAVLAGSGASSATPAAAAAMPLFAVPRRPGEPQQPQQPQQPQPQPQLPPQPLPQGPGPTASAAAVPPPAAPAAESGNLAADTVRISVAKLDARLVEAEEMLGVKLTTAQRAEDLRELGPRFEAWRAGCAAIEPEARAMRQAMGRATDGGAGPRRMTTRLLEFLDWNLDQLKAVEGTVAALTRSAEQDRHSVGRLVDDLMADSKKLLLFPFATLAASLAKPVRDLCRDQGKEADLRIQGEEVEIEKRILEEMKDPLLHLLRNGIDHGIESPEERGRRGKPARATITVAASRINGSKVQLLLSDDGAGIDTAKVKAAAIRHGLITAEAAARLDESEALGLVFLSEVSTSPIITQLSGRGLGLAIVREKARKLGGEVSVESAPGRGTTFRIVVPATRATFRGILVEAGGRQLLVPTAEVERVARIGADDIRTVEGRETVSQGGRAVSLVRLADALELPPGKPADAAADGVTVVVLGSGDERVAFVVDAVLDEQEVLVKPLPRPLTRVRNVSAAALLGSGGVAPILNVGDLLKSARRLSGAVVRAAAAPEPAHAQAVLVAEDSITSRLLIKGILESAGYRVTTAVDGMEAFGLLRAEAFDLVVSDVEMPRLNGFDLTARIRADRKLAELPVVLVTALETREDRERGVDAGANAYIVKSSFDQSNLLEAVRRLI